MCMEDVRLGRDLAVEAKSIALPNATATIVAGNDPNRTLIAFSFQPGSTQTIAPQGITPTALIGIILQTGAPYREFRVQDYGKLVQGPWQAFASAGGTAITVITASLTKQ